LFFFYSTYNPTYVLRQVFLYGIKKNYSRTTPLSMSKALCT
jgi:hypothetical protein